MRTILMFICCVILLSPCSAFARIPADILQQLENAIRHADTPEERAECFVCISRWHIRDKNFDSARSYLDMAVKENDQPWIRLMRSHIALQQKKYKQALDDATMAKNANKAFALEADKVIEAAETMLSLAYNMKHPKTIYLDTVVDQNRLSRFDLANLARNGGVEYQGKRYVTKEMGGLRRKPSFSDNGGMTAAQQELLKQALAAVDSMPTGPGGFKGRAGKARSETRKIKQAELRAKILAEAAGVKIPDNKQKNTARPSASTASIPDSNNQNITASNEHKYSGSYVKDVFGRNTGGKVDSAGYVRDNFGRRTGTTVDDSGYERNLWKQRTGDKAK